MKWPDLLLILIRWKRFILSFNIMVLVISIVVAYLLPKTYTSESVITLPEKTATPLDMLSGNLGLGAAMLGLSGTTPQSRYLAILDSRRLKESVIDSFDLKTFYETDNDEDVLRAFNKNYHVTNNKLLGTITISFDVKEDPEKAAAITAFIVRKLDEMNRELATENARAVRIFLENRYALAMKDLRALEDSMNRFQKKYGVIAIPEQMKASITAAAEIQAQITALETEYNVKKRELSQSHPDLQRLEATIQELRKVGRKMEYGDMNTSMFIPFKETPDLAMEYFRLYRDIQIQTKVLEFLVPQYEQAKLQEARDTPTLLVIDTAKIPAKHSAPKKKIVVLLGILLGLFLTAIVVFAGEYRSFLITHSSDPANQTVLLFMKHIRLKNWFKKNIPE